MMKDEKRRSLQIVVRIAAAAMVVWGGALGAEPGTAAEQSPSEVVRSLYKLHNQGRGPVFQKGGKRYIDRYFDTRLARLIWTDLSTTPSGEVGKLDFDPLFDTQDLRLSHLRVGEARLTGTSAAVLVTFDNYGKRGTVTCRMRRRGNVWRIADVDYGGGSTLAGILSGPG